MWYFFNQISFLIYLAYLSKKLQPFWKTLYIRMLPRVLWRSINSRLIYTVLLKNIGCFYGISLSLNYGSNAFSPDGGYIFLCFKFVFKQKVQLKHQLTDGDFTISCLLIVSYKNGPATRIEGRNISLVSIYLLALETL